MAHHALENVMNGSIATGSDDGVEAGLRGRARLLPSYARAAGWLKLSLNTGCAQYTRSPLYESKAACRVLSRCRIVKQERASHQKVYSQI